MFQPRTLTELASEWPPELDHISASSVKMIARCPEQWRQRYLEGRKSPPAAALIAGRADHGAIEKSMSQKIQTGEDLPLGEVKDEFYSIFEEEVDAAGLDELEVVESGVKLNGKAAKVKVLDKMKVVGGELVGLYHVKVSPQLQPLAVEMPFEIHAQNLPVKVEGRIDLVVMPRGQEESDDPLRFIIDRKRSGARSVVRPQPEWVIQAEVYQLVEPVPHAWHISLTSGSPKLIVPDEVGSPLFMAPKDEMIAATQLEHLAAEIGYLYMRYGPDGPWPTRGKLHPWACNYCGFRDTCWGWKES